MNDSLKVLLLSNYEHLDYTRFFPNGEMRYGNIEYVTTPDNNIDAVVICNHSKEKVSVSVAPENIFHIHQEPGDKLYHGFMFNSVVGKKCGHLELCDIKSHPCLNWLVNKTYDELVSFNTDRAIVWPQKTEHFSAVISGHNALPGHYQRLKLLDKILSQSDIALFGKRHNFIPDKWDAMYPYKYSLAMENSRQNDYWTEKIMDCFLACTMPVYSGCHNIGKYFPKNSYIELDIDNIDYSIKAMKEKIQGGFFEENYASILEARELCLNQYATAPALSLLVNNNIASARKNSIIIKPFKRTLLTDLKRKLLRNKFAHKMTHNDN